MTSKKKWTSAGRSVAELEREVRRHNRLYFQKHQPEISDAAFDRLVEKLRRLKPDSTALSAIPSDVAATGAKVTHVVTMLSLDKCYDEKTLHEWAAKFSGPIVASPKIDGCAVALRYDGAGRLALAATRGDGVTGEAITANMQALAAIPKRTRLHNIEVRGEVFMPLSVFARYRSEFSNPRNLAAGAIKQKDAQKTAEYQLAFFAYDLLGSRATTESEKRRLLRDGGFPVVEGRLIEREDMQQTFDDFLARRHDCDFETDGVVFRADRVAEQERLGSTAHHPRAAIAYKFQGDSGVTRLIDVEWSVSRTGAITPVGIVEPVELSGALVRRASLHNVGLMQKLGVARGAKVLMMRRGGVIPNLETVIERGNAPIEIPTRCPSCGAATKLRDDFLFCTAPTRCVQSKIGELAHFVKTVGIDGFGEKLLAQLAEQGVVTNPAEVYALTADELLRLERMGETLAAKLINNIEEHRSLPLDLFLQSLGIRELGKHVAKILAGMGSLEKILALSAEDLAAIHTIGPVIARSVVKGLKAKRRLIEKLLSEITIAPTRKSSAGGILAGKRVLFTGTLAAMERKGAEQLVEKAGGTLASSVSRELDYLVVGSAGGAGAKLKKAEELAAKGGKVQILTEAKFFQMIS